MTDAARHLRRAAAAITLVLAIPSCAGSKRSSPALLDAAKVSAVIIGRSSRTDVFATLGRPTRTERSAAGEAWVYESKEAPQSGPGFMGGVAAASGVVGAFVPYAGLVGSGIGLASATTGGPASPPTVVTLTVTFRPDSVVRDCLYTSNASPAGMPGAGARSLDCQRPDATAASPL